MTIIKTISVELEELNPTFSSKKYILAVSGGVDSMVLLDCFKNLNLNFEVAHFNFQLRGEESDGDEALISSVCSNQNIPFNLNTVDTNTYATKNKLSIQEAARELRYNWFFSLLKEKNADYIVTGHHANDSIETFFINLLRGTGIKGLIGIKNNNQIIRPLLSVWRKDIETYASNANIEFRNDSSNESIKYKRNFIRKKIIPELNQKKENASTSILKSIGHLSQVNTYLEKKLAIDIEKITTVRGNIIYISTEQSIEDLVLYSALSKYGFNESQIQSIQTNTKATGKKHYSVSHELLVNRDQLIIQPLNESVNLRFEIPTLGIYDNPFNINFTEIESPESFLTDKNTILLDRDLIAFPFTIRKWKEGDWFIPFGMKGKKKLSDFFIDEKFSQFEKENTWLLVNDDQIVWVVNHRLDDRYRIKESTTNVLQVVTK